VTKIEKQHVMGIIGSGLATFVALVLAAKYHQSLVLSAIELIAMFVASIFVARKSLPAMYAMTGYFGIILGIPMLLSGNPITIVMVIGVLYLLVQGVIGISEVRAALRPRKELVLSDSDRALMYQHGVEHNGQYFIAGDMHFDHFHDAIAHATHLSSGAA
jgi:hypothetical protein